MERGLAATFAQNYPALEVVVVDDGSTDNTEEVCKKFPVKYIKVPPHEWGGTAKAANIGFRAATHDIVIIQHAEIVHQTPGGIQALVDLVKDNELIWVHALTLAQTDVEGTKVIPYASEHFQRRCAIFCCALWKKHLLKIRGFDEDYFGIGWREDDDLADRLIDKVGLTKIYTDTVKVLHLWHPSDTIRLQLIDDTLYNRKTELMARGVISEVRNLGREWGCIS